MVLGEENGFIFGARRQYKKISQVEGDGGNKASLWCCGVNRSKARQTFFWWTEVCACVKKEAATTEVASLFVVTLWAA